MISGLSGQSVVTQGIVLPSKVTGLVIKKPNNFKHSPGDWVFIKIPQIARFEWHPFTISSAPEEKVHIFNQFLKKKDALITHSIY